MFEPPWISFAPSSPQRSKAAFPPPVASCGRRNPSSDGFKARAKTMREGLEPELPLLIDVMYPMSELIEAVAKFRDTLSHTPPRLFVEVLRY